MYKIFLIFFAFLATGCSSADNECDISQLFEKKEYNLALECADAQIKYAENKITPWEWKVLIFEETEQPDSMINALSVLVAIDPEYAPYYEKLGLAYRKLGNYNAAEERFLKASSKISSNDSKINNLQYLAANASDMGEFKRSLEYLDSALKLDSTNASTHTLASNIYMDRGEILKAMENIQKAYQIDSVDIEILATKALIYKKQHKVDSAIITIQAAITNSPRAVHLYYYRSVIYEDYNMELACEQRAFAQELGYQLPEDDRLRKVCLEYGINLNRDLSK